MNTTALLKKLIEFKTVTGNQEEHLRAFAWIKNLLKDLPLYFSEPVYNGFPSLLITTRETKNPKAWLVAHMDVVPASDAMFKPKTVKDKLFGRGVFDMKFAIASYLNLLLTLGNDVSNYDFGIMLVSDEETGGFNGAKKLVEDNYRSEFILLPDGGEDWVLQEAAKGVFSIQFTSVGKSAHGARPWLGENAIDALTDFLTKIREEFRSEPCDDATHFHTTLNVGLISGGKATNQVPDLAEARIDIRFIPTTNFAEIENRVQNVLKDFPMISMKVRSRGVGYQIDKENIYLRSFIETMKENGLKEQYLKSHGSSDARYFIERGIPAILIRPEGGNLHSENEWIDIESLELFSKILNEFIEKVGRVKK